MKKKALIYVVMAFATATAAYGQYVQPERDDTVRMYAKTPFDSVAAQAALAEGTGVIKGVAYTKPKTPLGYSAPLAKRIYANKITVYLFPVTPYLLDYLKVKQKENPVKLKFAYIDPVAWKFKLTAVTNSDGEFTFPKMKPGKYYLEAILPWDEGNYYDAYTGSGYAGNARADYYERRYYTTSHYDKLDKFVELEEGETLSVKLK